MADSSNSHLPRTPFRAWQAFMWSLKGLKTTWQVESSFRLEVYLCVVLIPLGLYLGQNPVEKFLLVSVLLLVLIVEVLNSAIEAVVDRWGIEHHELAGRAKDMGSAAVFLADINVIVCWGLILWPTISKEF
jgi:diacylglycerol kinase (ATP)